MKKKKLLENQGHRFIGNHSSTKICRWTKKALTNEGECYKQKFYGIKSHLCCQMSPWISCQNMCNHCWRPIEVDFNKLLVNNNIDDPEIIIKGSIEAQQKLLIGFKGNNKINMKKFNEAQEPMQFAISLTGEPTLYPKLGELIELLRKSGKTSFVVTNGLAPVAIKKLFEKNQLPTQIYISLNSPNEKHYLKWHKSKVKESWKKFNESLKLFSKIKTKTRTVIRMTLVKDKNMEKAMVEKYVELINKANPDFIEVKGFMSVGFARNRKGMGYDSMPSHEDIKEYAKQIVESLGKPYKILDEHIYSRVVLIGKDKKKMLIKRGEV